MGAMAQHPSLQPTDGFIHPWIIFSSVKKGSWARNHLGQKQTEDDGRHVSAKQEQHLPGMYFCGLLLRAGLGETGSGCSPGAPEVPSDRQAEGRQACVGKNRSIPIYSGSPGNNTTLGRVNQLRKLHFGQLMVTARPEVLLKKEKRWVGRRDPRCMSRPLLFAGEQVLVSVHQLLSCSEQRATVKHATAHVTMERRHLSLAIYFLTSWKKPSNTRKAQLLSLLRQKFY